MTPQEINKRIAAFYQEFFNGHDISAAEKYVKEDYHQHNPGVQQGRAALMQAFEERFRVDPVFHLELQRIITDGEYAAVYIKNVGADGKTKIRLVDIYRLEDGMLAEHWDVLQPV